MNLYNKKKPKLRERNVKQDSASNFSFLLFFHIKKTTTDDDVD